MTILGKEIRLNRLINQSSGKLLAVAVDQAVARGIFEELMPIGRKIDEIIAGEPDAITMHKGIATSCFEQHAGKAGLILKLSSFSPWQPNYDAWVTEVEEALPIGADAVSMGCIVGGDDQPEQLRNLGIVAGKAAQYGLPMIAHIYPRGNQIPDDEKNDWKHVAYAVRAGAELGVDIVKTKYTGDPETFHKVVSSTPAKVVVAGGDNGNDIKDYFQMVHDVLDAGGTGITFGRIVWNNPNPTAVVKSFKHIIHDQGTVKEAIELYEELSNVTIKN
ncbi:class I fructose-bisphosphate aldolase [Domibacillus enclensis]|uniref:Fructose-bisphosphate aldolase n=1 Tax=Domibacillus enclensis TaxID=1017273 RepID=A0A1N7C1T1_9BACI|nr:2-amino-3,7-dideoxy-D-threo-hept-6-ulosonate synthase [Domibacillus enclensis]OXS74203.1 fructose-bisphosphate aldolase [Domibacillus enclensis]SIR57576.1 fructose-bisphosphate aldolase, class I/fructose-bisphosphate aldolase / 2-amino-3,7-dideoxy-D-threo-hept-6-ulosonate synthase [Domibacillus enclensis]